MAPTALDKRLLSTKDLKIGKIQKYFWRLVNETRIERYSKWKDMKPAG